MDKSRGLSAVAKNKVKRSIKEVRKKIRNLVYGKTAGINTKIEKEYNEIKSTQMAPT